ncbi:HET-domain-containing protein, partial [Ophiobolus disseminans]
RCRQTHPSCQKGTSDSVFTPTRLVGITGSQSELIVLRDKPVGPYAVLSHCWGSVQPFTLNRGTLSELRNGVAVTRLSKTFQDAITVITKFGIQLIWIDSLCICQDDENDWAVEASRMRDVYRNSAICIAATAAKDGNMGLFFERDTRGFTSIKMDLSWPNALQTLKDDPEVAPMGNYWVGGQETSGHAEIDNSPLNKRSWVAQERFLAPRIMHFTRESLYYECQELLTHESSPDGLLERPSTSQLKGLVCRYQNILSNSSSSSQKDSNPALFLPQIRRA